MGDEEVYEVEKILNHKTNKGVTYYKLKWKGFPMSDCTWEEESSLDCPELLNEYWNNLKSPKKQPESPNTKNLSPLNKKLIKQSPEKQTKINFMRNESNITTTQKKIDTSSLDLNHQNERDISDSIKKELLDKDKVEGKKKKVVQSQIDKLLKNTFNQQKTEKEKKVEKKEINSQISNHDYEIIAAARNPKNNAVLYLIRRLKNDEVITKVVSSEYARNHLAQPLINFYLNNLKITKPI